MSREDFSTARLDRREDPSFQAQVLVAVARKLAPPESYRCSIKTATIPPALVFAVSALVYADLAKKDFEDTWYGWPLAATSFIVNYVQITIPTEETFRRYLLYVRNAYRAMREESGWDELMGTSNLEPNEWQTLAIKASKIGYFFSTEGVKLWLLYYMAVLPAALTRDTPDFNNNFWGTALWIATFAFLESAVHERLQKIPWPALSNYLVLNQNIRQFRQTINDMLGKNALRLRDKVTSKQAQELIALVKQGHHQASNHVLLRTALANIRKYNTTKQRWIKRLENTTAIVFLLLYLGSNGGVYRQTWRDAEDFSFFQRLASMSGDGLFGLFMSLRAAKLFLNALLGRLSHYRIFSWQSPWNSKGEHWQSPIAFDLGYEWRETVLFWVSVSISATTFFSTLAVAKDENMPPLVKYSTIPGSTYDNSAFSIELAARLLIAWDLHQYASGKRNRDRDDHVIITTLFRTLQEYLDELSNKQFIALFQNYFQFDSNLFNVNQMSHIHAALPWGRDNHYGASHVVHALGPQSLANGLQQLNANGRHGVWRNRYEWVMALMAAAIVSLGFIPAHGAWQTVLQYGAPAISVALPVGLMYFGDYLPHKRKIGESRPLLGSNGHRKTVIKRHPRWEQAKNLFLFLLSSGTPVAVQIVMLYLTHWCAEHIFDKNEEQATAISRITATTVTAATAAVRVTDQAWAFR